MALGEGRVFVPQLINLYKRMDNTLAKPKYNGCMKDLMETSRAYLENEYRVARDCVSNDTDCDAEVSEEIQKHFVLSQSNASAKEQCDDAEYGAVLKMAQNLSQLRKEHQAEAVKRFRTSDALVQKLGQ